MNTKRLKIPQFKTIPPHGTAYDLIKLCEVAEKEGFEYYSSCGDIYFEKEVLENNDQYVKRLQKLYDQEKAQKEERRQQYLELKKEFESEAQ